MSVMPLGNLAQSMVARHAQTRIQSDLTRLSLELTTGLTQDIGQATQGDTRALTALNRQISDLDAYGTALSEAATLARSTGMALSSIRTRLANVNEGVAALAQSRDQTQYGIVEEQARASFLGIIGDLNTQVAGRELFSGTAQSGPSTRPGEDILADIAAAVSGATSAAGLVSAVDAYFGPGGAFETNDYLGAITDISPIRISPEDRVTPTVRADDTAIRDSLKSLAYLSVLGDLGLTERESQSVIDRSLENVINSDRNLIEAEARVGAAEARIDIAASRSTGARAAYESARLDTLGIDPYATATRIEQTQTQLQTLYTLTARISGLNLVNFL